MAEKPHLGLGVYDELLLSAGISPHNNLFERKWAYFCPAMFLLPIGNRSCVCYSMNYKKSPLALHMSTKHMSLEGQRSAITKIYEPCTELKKLIE